MFFKPGKSLQPLRGRVAVEARHHHVEQREVRLHSVGDGERFGAAPAAVHLVAHLEDLREHAADRVVVLRDQDALLRVCFVACRALKARKELPHKPSRSEPCPAPASDASRLRRPRAGRPIVCGAVPRVLHIEDDPANRLLVRKLLGPGRLRGDRRRRRPRGHPPALAERPDLVLVDITIPGLDGYEVTLRLRAEPTLRGVPIVAITAEGDRDTSLAVGCDGFLQKPIDARSFADTVARLPRGRRERAAAGRRERAAPAAEPAHRRAPRAEGRRALARQRAPARARPGEEGVLPQHLARARDADDADRRLPEAPDRRELGRARRRRSTRRSARWTTACSACAASSTTCST